MLTLDLKELREKSSSVVRDRSLTAIGCKIVGSTEDWKSKKEGRRKGGKKKERKRRKGGEVEKDRRRNKKEVREKGRTYIFIPKEAEKY